MAGNQDERRKKERKRSDQFRNSVLEKEEGEKTT